MNTPVDRLSFDHIADSFESRSALPEGMPKKIADAVRDYADLQPGDLLVEIGAGTGLIGQWLARLPIRYLGLDSSRPMLDMFEPRLRGSGTASLRHTDANQRWPVADGSAHAVFGSRCFQLLDIDHLVREANRVGHPDRAVLIEGTFEPGPDSPKVIARTRLRELLRARGLKPRPVQRLLRQVLETAEAQGGSIMPPHTVATWQWAVPPQEVIDNWQQKGSLGGINPPPDVAAAVMDELVAWVAQTWSDPAKPVMSEETYVLRGVQLRTEGGMT